MSNIHGFDGSFILNRYFLKGSCGSWILSTNFVVGSYGSWISQIVLMWYPWILDLVSRVYHGILGILDPVKPFFVGSCGS